MVVGVFVVFHDLNWMGFYSCSGDIGWIVDIQCLHSLFVISCVLLTINNVVRFDWDIAIAVKASFHTAWPNYVFTLDGLWY